MAEIKSGGKKENTENIFALGGEMGARMRETDWTKTPLGAPDAWQQSLKTAVRIMLNSRYPMFVWWGASLINFYNDAYIPILGKRHPHALGRPAQKVWAEIWDVVGAEAETVLRRGRATWNSESLLVMERNDFTEETYFTWSYSPIMDDDGEINGVFCACSEETAKVIGRRRMKTLQNLGERALAQSSSAGHACRAAALTFSENESDIPFALIYLLDDDGKTARLCELTGGIEKDSKSAPETAEIESAADVWEFSSVLKKGRGRLIEDIDKKFGELPAGAWTDDFTRQAYVVPLAEAGTTETPAGFLVAGVSPRLVFDEEYRGFLDLVAGQIATAAANARKLEDRKKRVEAKLELSRLKLQLAENLRESEERFRRIADTAPVLVWISDTTKDRVWFNRSWLEFTGRRMEEEYGAGWTENIHPEDFERYLEIYGSSFDERKSFSMEYRIRRRDGAYRWLLDNGVPNYAPGGEFLGYMGSCIDITELKESKAILERYRLISEKARDIVWLVRPDGRIVEANKAAVEFYGYSREELLKMNLSDLREGSTLNQLNGQLKKAFETGANFETYHRRKDGSVFPVEVNATGADFGGERLIMSIVRDISERKQAEANQKFLLKIAEMIRRANHSEKLIFNAVRLISRHFRVSRSLFMEIDRAADRAIIHKDYYAENLKSVKGEIPLSQFSPDSIEILRKGTTLVNSDIKNNPRTARFYESGYKHLGMEAFVGVPLLRDGKWIAALAVIEDRARVWTATEIGLLEAVAERIWLAVEKLRGERALRESEQRLQLAIAISQTATFEIDLLTDAVKIDETGREIYGWDSPPATFSRVQSHFHPEDREEVLRKVSAAFEPEGANDFEVEQRIIRTDGETRWIRVHGRAFFEGEGEARRAVRCLGTYIDITDRKKAEEFREELLRSEQEARLQAEQANRLKDEFLATVSHELRTPLNAMLGWAAMVRQNNFDADVMRRAFEVVERNARSQNQIISDILDVSRIITGKLNLNLQAVELSPVIQSAIDTVRPAADAKNIDLEFYPAPDAETVRGDADRLQQIFWNLLSNAVKFTPDGGKIEIALSYNEDSAEISVTDSGSGIEAEFLPFVFDRFRQADGRTNRRHGGLGLGLSIVRHLTELHGGSVFAKSGDGRGATFTVRLPLRRRGLNEPGKNGLEGFENDAGIISASARMPRRPLDGIKILLVDDEPDALDLVSFILNGHNAQVFTAESVDEALEIFESENLDLLISDIGMPEKDGYELIREVKAAGAARRGGAVPALALTAYAGKKDNRLALEAGFDAYLPKPVEPERLVETVVALIAGK